MPGKFPASFLLPSDAPKDSPKGEGREKGTFAIPGNSGTSPGPSEGTLERGKKRLQVRMQYGLRWIQSIPNAHIQGDHCTSMQPAASFYSGTPHRCRLHQTVGKLSLSLPFRVNSDIIVASSYFAADAIGIEAQQGEASDM